MNTKSVKNQPAWIPHEDAWHLVAGKRIVASLIPARSHPSFPDTLFYVSLVAPAYWPYADGWHAVDFRPLRLGKRMMRQWWDRTASRLASVKGGAP